MSLSIGTTLGSYEITALLGKGGMGEVYRARDSKLKREVAIKILPDEFARDPDRVSRFQREAEVVASLNHPNIGAIYDVQEQTDFRFLILELVEGETLAERIARGPIPVEEALQIARQICEALETAHEKGIVHRDLKPANVKIQPDGKVKVLDFGLAKALENRPANVAMSQSPTLSLAATNAGGIIGTAAYMSPEQVRGFAADPRSDIFSFGCVLYEMLTGRQTFQGETISDVLASVLTRDPDLSLLPSKLNPRISDLLRRCLERNPKRRWHASGDVRIEVEAILADPRGLVAVEEHASASKLPWKRAIAMLLIGTLAGGALASVGWWYFRPSSPAPVMRFPFFLGEGQQFTNPGRQLVAISPDGMQMVYVATNRLYLRRMSELEARPIPGTEEAGGVLNPVFSPDGRSIVFWSFADKALKKIAVTGGAPVTICQADSVYGMSWSADGILFGQDSKGIMRVSENGGKPETLVSVKSNELAHGPQTLPGEGAVLFTLATPVSIAAAPTQTDWDKAQIVIEVLKSGERKVLNIPGGSDARYVSTGHIVYALGGTLFAVPFDLRRLEVTGGPVPVLEGVRRSSGATGSAHFSFSNAGSLIYIPGPASTSLTLQSLGLFDRKGTAEPLKLQPGPYAFPRVSPDGKRITYGTDDGKDVIVWTYDLSGASSPQHLTFGGKNRYPVWSADGKRIAFQSDREGELAIFWQQADGTGTAERLTKPEQGTSHVPESWSKTGVLSFDTIKGANHSLWLLSLADKKTTAFGNVQSRTPINSVFSPDGHWLAYTSSENGQNEVFVQPFPSTGAKYQVTKDGESQVVWSRDGKELFVARVGGRFASFPVTLQPRFTTGIPEQITRPFRLTNTDNARNFDVTPDGRFIGVSNGDPTQLGTQALNQIQIVLNWFNELQQRVPVK